MSYVYVTEENAKIYKRGGRYILGRNLEVVMEMRNGDRQLLTLW